VEKVLKDLQATYLRAIEIDKLSAAVRCLELQGKHLGMFTNKVEVKPTIEEASTEELVELLREIMQAGNLDIRQLLPESEINDAGNDNTNRLLAVS
jgi:hypothetical protein